MSTFASIGLTFGVASCFMGVALIGFSSAVQCQANGLLAPRTYARPKSVIKNVLKRPFSLRWIPWALNLTYLQMLQGIDGTGTRRDGWSGSKLRANLDSVILLRYHSLCLKVSIFATILCLLIVLPINYTAPCDPELVGNATCRNMTNLTDFENTTLAHIPVLDFSGNPASGGLKFVGGPFKNAPWLAVRLWAIVMVAYAIYAYTCSLIWEQWIENLALRRAYYLEFNHYKARKEELEYLENLKDPEDPLQENRPVFIPQPELRDTVPNISLYSVLYKLPSIHFASKTISSISEAQRQLQTAVDFFDKVVPNQPGYSSSVAAVTILPDVNQVSKAWGKWFECASKLRRLRFIRQRLRKLHEEKAMLTSDILIFDDDAPAGEDSKQKENIENNAQSNYCPPGSDCDTANGNGTRTHHRNQPRPSSTPSAGRQILETVDEGSTGDLSSLEDGPSIVLSEVIKKGLTSQLGETESQTNKISSETKPHLLDIESSGSTAQRRIGRTESELKRNRFIASIGLTEESKLEMFLSEDEIEQMTVYCREFARSSATCGPFGCDESTIRWADEETLLEMEQDAEEAVQDACEELRRARAEVHRSLTSGQETFTIRCSKNTDLLKDGVAQMVGLNNIEANDVEYGIDPSSGGFDVSESEIDSNQNRSSLSHQWKVAERMVASERNVVRGHRCGKRKLDNGHWYNPFQQKNEEPTSPSKEMEMKSEFESSKGIIDTDSYAVVTFTSRQAAIAARQCLADGTGLDRWREVDVIPIAPLADSPPWNIFDCRGCCRPVTVTLPHEQKRWRRNFIVVVVVLFCLSYTYPLTYFATLVTPQKLEQTFPEIPQIGRLSGLLSGGMRVLFFALCPQIFKAFANFGSGAVSIQEAERNAVRYYWFFMLVTAFTGTSLATVITEALVVRFNVGGTAREILRSVGSTVPTTISAQWLSWIIFRTGITLPYNYLLQFNNFMFSALGMKCCARATAGGGAGGIAPFRIYVDCGVVFLCVVGLAPACPLIAPFAMLCYLLLIPMLRWLVIFTYRPVYDAGGMRWPLLHNILISSMIWAQIVLAAMMGVKRAYGAAIFAGLAVVPTWTFHVVCHDRFSQCYEDAGLLQTSELDGWNVEEKTSIVAREGYRKWLVDCHKASYIPICVNGEDNCLTAEPAAVIPTDRDDDDIIPDSLNSNIIPLLDSPDRSSTASPVSGGERQRASTMDSYSSWLSQSSAGQKGALYRRVSKNIAYHLPPKQDFAPYEGRRRAVSGGSAVSFSSPLVDAILDGTELADEPRTKSI